MKREGFPRALSINPRHHQALLEVTSEAVDLALRRRKDLPGLLAIVMVGAPSHGEGTAISAPDRVLVLSDIDLLLVFESASPARSARAVASNLSREATQVLGARTLTSHVDYSVHTPLSLGALGPSMLSMDTQQHGRILFGEKSVLDGMRPVSAADIPADDAIALVMNRAVGQLVFGQDNRSHVRSRRLFAAYHSAKVACDVLGAYLCYHGLYRGTFARRIEEARRLATADLAPLLPASTLAQAERWTRFKLDPDSDPLSPELVGEERGSVAAAERLWSEARELLIGAWRALGAHAAGLDAGAKPEFVARKLLYQQRLSEVLRDWARFIRHPMVRHERIDWVALGRFVTKASPGFVSSIGAIHLLAGDLDAARRFAFLRPDAGSSSANDATRASILRAWHLAMKGGAD